MNRIKISLLLLTTLLISNLATYAQSNVPQGVNYQCIIRDIDGKPVANQNVVVNISVFSGIQSDILEWKEFHSTKTNNYGLVNLVIGEGTSTGQGRAVNFTTIPWNLGNLFVEVSVNFGKGENNLGMVKLQSVPYALVAQHALTVDYNNITNKPNNLFTESDPVYLSSTAAKIKASDTVRWSKPSSFSGNYNDLLNKPDLSGFIRNESDPSFQSSLAARITIADTTRWGKHFSGNYSDLRNKPALATVATTGNYTDLNGKPTLATVATSGNYNDLTNKPNLSQYIQTENDPIFQNSVAANIKTTDTTRWGKHFSGNYADLKNKPTLSNVATSGSYTDLVNKPNLATVATSGDYNDLTNKPVGQATGDMLYWNGSKWGIIPIGNNTQMLSIANGKPEWVNQTIGGGTSTIPQIVTENATINYSSQLGAYASIPYMILNADGTAITSRGVCWGTSSNPTISGNKTLDGVGLGSYTSNLFGLTSGTTLYARAYVTTSSGAYYGNEISFIADGTIQLTAQVVNTISATKAYCTAYMSGQGGYPLLSSGLCWSKTPTPTIANSKNNGIYDPMTGLTPNTKYYVRAYATNATGAYYSNELSFITGPSVISFTSSQLSSIKSTSVECSANIDDDGGSTIATRGICWGTSPNPTATNNYKSIGAGLGNYNATITGLTPETKYYVRAFATNSNGIYYGEELSFTTAPSIIILSAELSSTKSISAVFSANITDDGGFTITTRGFCWGTTPNPTTTGNYKSNGAGVGNYNVDIDGLTSETKYYVRAFATNSKGTFYSNELSFTTTPSVIMFASSELSSTKSTSASLSANIIDDGGFAISARGICWGTAPNPTLSGNYKLSGTGLGNYNVNMEGLTSETKYYVRAYATNSKGTFYSNELSFTTTSSLILFSSTEFSFIKSATVGCYGRIIDDGGFTITTRGFCWGTAPKPTIAGNYKSSGAGLGDYAATITGLSPETKYYIRAYATNSNGTFYGDELSFTTTASVIHFSEFQLSSPKSTSTSCSVNIMDDGDFIVTTRGFCWGTAPNPTTSDNYKSSGNGLGPYYANIEGLTPETKYYVRAYATNTNGTFYGDELSFTTMPAIIMFSSPETNSIKSTSASCSVNIIDDGGFTITSRGFCWGTTPNPTTSGTYKSNGTSVGSYSVNLTGLLPQTKYYVRAYAINSKGTSYGEELSFTTAPAIIMFSSPHLSSPKSTSVECSANVTDDGGFTITTKGFCWGTVSNPTTSGNYKSIGAGVGGYNATITGLNPETKYYVRAYATNSKGTFYGDELSFTTASSIILFSSSEISSTKSTSVVCSANIGDDGGFTIISKGFCWGTDPNPLISGNYTSSGAGLGYYTANITGLSPQTKYYVRAFATNGNGTFYGDELSFTTAPAVIMFSSSSLSSVKSTSVACSSSITDDGGFSITAKGFCWGTAPNPTTSGTYTSSGAGSGNFSTNINGLTPQTRYYVRAYAINSKGTFYGDELSFTTTASIVILNTTQLSNTKSSSAYCQAEIVDDGGFTVTERGVCWNTSPNPTIASNFKANSWGMGSYDINLTGLTPNTKYYVRAYAKNSIGTHYGNELNFTTNPAVITFTSPQLSSINSSSVNCSSYIDDDGGATVTSRGVCWSTSPNPLVTGNSKPYGSGTGGYNLYITDLTPETKYYVRSYAINSNGTFYSDELSFTTTTPVFIINTSEVSNKTSSSATCGANITTDGGYPITSYGVCWSTSPNPTTSGNFKESYYNGSPYFDMNITGLTPNTGYYVRAYAINNKGTFYGNELNFTTNPAVIIFENIDPYQTYCNSTRLRSSIIDDGTNTITAMGFCWSTTPHPTTSNSVVYQSTINRNLDVGLTSLTPNTTYYVRAFAVTPDNTFYSDERTFKTALATISVYNNQVNTPDGITANCNANISSNCFSYTEAGFCYATTQNPTIANQKIVSIPSYGSMSATITGLNYGTTYFIRAYVKNETETIYGDEVYFTTGTGAITIEAGDISNITATSAVANANITNLGGISLIKKGFCRSTNPNPTIQTGVSKDTVGKEGGPFTATLNNLLPNKTYYVRGYAINAKDTFYTTQKTFTTLSGAVTITTIAPTNVGGTTATSGGTITSTSGINITDKGICWSTSPNPTINNSYASSGGGNDSYTTTLTGLDKNVQYYIRAYAINATGVWYGNELNFTTQYGKVFFETAVSNIGSTIAQISVKISDFDEASITDKGIQIRFNGGVWANLSYGAGKNEIYPKLTNLMANTNYDVRAYAVNSEGTWYGNPISFTTKSGSDLTDIDGNKYPIVTLNGQTWMAENLRSTHYQNGDPIPNIVQDDEWIALTTGARCYYNGNDSSGVYYNYYTITDDRKLCPVGWHVPSNNEWSILINSINDPTSLLVGGATGFNITHAGIRIIYNPWTTGWIHRGYTGYYWTSSQHDPSGIYGISSTTSSINSSIQVPQSGMSVRCIKD